MPAESIEAWHDERASAKIDIPSQHSHDKQLQETRQQKAELSCKQLCHQIRAKLPREVRDLIYELLVGPSTASLANVMDKRNFPPVEILNREQWPPHLYHCWIPYFLGFSVFQELVETWYRVTVFHIDQPSSIVSLLSQDPFRIVSRPADFISHIAFTIAQFPDFDPVLNFSEEPSWSDLMKRPSSSPSLTPLTTTMSSLRSLAKFRPGTRIIIWLESRAYYLHSHLWKGPDDGILAFFQTLNPGVFECLRELRALGYHLNIILDSKLRLTSHADFSSDAWFEEVKSYQRKVKK